MSKTRLTAIFAVFLVAIASVVAGCGGSGNSSSSTTTGGGGGEEEATPLTVGSDIP
jgi:hypothetical protein